MKKKKLRVAEQLHVKSRYKSAFTVPFSEISDSQESDAKNRVDNFPEGICSQFSNVQVKR